MQSNIGIVNALIRLTCGFTMLAWATAKMVKRPYNDTYCTIAMLAAMKIGEGITRFCPVTYLYKQYNEQQQNNLLNKESDNQSNA